MFSYTAKGVSFSFTTYIMKIGGSEKLIHRGILSVLKSTLLKKTKALICCVCQFTSCKYSLFGWFQATNVVWLNAKLGRDMYNGLWWAGLRGLGHTTSGMGPVHFIIFNICLWFLACPYPSYLCKHLPALQTLSWRFRWEDTSLSETINQFS